MAQRIVWAFVVSVVFSVGAFAESARLSPPAIVLAEIYRQSVDPSLYLVSEKYDGVRAIWDGRELRFRSGNRVNAPLWFTAGLPPIALDGELWLGRGQFSELAGIVRYDKPNDAQWRRVRYMIFELPDAPGNFAARAEQMAVLVRELKLPWLYAVDQFRVADTKSLLSHFKRITKEGAEGLMLHRADASYVTGRSDVLLKLKPLLDAEATVIGYVAGNGRIAGNVGALIMEMPNGKRFRIGSGLSDELRLRPPPIGSLVTYRYQELSPAGIPRFPRYWRIREDF